MEAEPMQPAANPAADVPWWLSEAVRTTEPSRPPVLWQPAKVWNARGTAPAGEPLPVGPNANPEPQQPWESGAEAQQMPRPEAAAEETQGSGAEEAPSNLNSRLSGLRNLLYAMGVKNANDGGNSAGQAGGAGSDYDLRTERASFERGGPQTPVDAASGMRGAAPQLVTAPPEFLPPRPVVIEIDKTDPHTGESSTRQDRRTPYDRVDILPSKRGQYKKV